MFFFSISLPSRFPCTQNAIHLEALLPTKWVNCGVVKTKRSGIDLKKLVGGERKKAIDGNSPELLDVGGDARQSINAIDDAVLLDELGAAFQHHRDWGRKTRTRTKRITMMKLRHLWARLFI
jgi:hypothetical protein